MVLGDKVSRNTNNNQRSTSMNNEPQGWTEADKVIWRWTGRAMPEFKLAPETPTDKQHPSQIARILTSATKYVNNPELVFGICRRLLTMNVFRQSNFENVMKYHPVWSQLWCYNEEDNKNGTIKVENFERDLKSFRIEAGGTETEDGNVTGGTVTVRDKNGKTVKRNIQSAVEIKGTVIHQYIGEHGAKTEAVKLGLTVVKYEDDSRPYIALNLGGGCAARYFLLKVGDRPDYEVNNDSAIKRKSFKDETEQEKYAEKQAARRHWNSPEAVKKREERAQQARRRAAAAELDINDVRQTIVSGQTFGLDELNAMLSKGGVGSIGLQYQEEVKARLAKQKPRKGKVSKHRDKKARTARRNNR